MKPYLDRAEEPRANILSIGDNRSTSYAPHAHNDKDPDNTAFGFAFPYVDGFKNCVCNFVSCRDKNFEAEVTGLEERAKGLDKRAAEANIALRITWSTFSWDLIPHAPYECTEFGAFRDRLGWRIVHRNELRRQMAQAETQLSLSHAVSEFETPLLGKLVESEDEIKNASFEAPCSEDATSHAPSTQPPPTTSQITRKRRSSTAQNSPSKRHKHAEFAWTLDGDLLWHHQVFHKAKLREWITQMKHRRRLSAEQLALYRGRATENDRKGSLKELSHGLLLLIFLFGHHDDMYGIPTLPILASFLTRQKTTVQAYRGIMIRALRVFDEREKVGNN